MPLPKPKKGQTEDEFIEQCMSDPKMTAEFPDRKQRFAVCSGQLKAHKLEPYTTAQEYDLDDSVEIE